MPAIARSSNPLTRVCEGSRDWRSSEARLKYQPPTRVFTASQAGMKTRIGPGPVIVRMITATGLTGSGGMRGTKRRQTSAATR